MTAKQNLIVGKSRRPTISRDGLSISVHIPITCGTKAVANRS